MALDIFSRRELEVIELLAQGLANKDIAKELFIEEKSVKTHITSILKKSKCESRAEFISKLLRGLIAPQLFPFNYNGLDKYF